MLSIQLGLIIVLAIKQVIEDIDNSPPDLYLSGVLCVEFAGRVDDEL